MGPSPELPLISIVTPSYNQGAFIEETIRSVSDQGYPALEHIVIDGGSTDGTIDVLRRFPHLRWVSEPDAGQSDAINKGFRQARGEILAWLNADDTYRPGALYAVAAFLSSRPDVDLVYGDCDEVDTEGRTIGHLTSRPFDLPGLLRLEYHIPQPATFFRRRLVERIGDLDTRMHLAMDFDYWVRAARSGRLAYSGEVWAAFRIHPSAKTSARAREVLFDHLATLDRLFSDPDLPASVRGVRREAYANACLAGGVHSYELGHRAEARERLLASLRWYPHPARPKTLKALLYLLDTVLGVTIGSHITTALRRVRRG